MSLLLHGFIEYPDQTWIEIIQNNDHGTKDPRRPRGRWRVEGKSKRAEKYGTKKSKERREEPLGTMSYQTSSNGRRRSGFWLVPEKHKCREHIKTKMDR